MLSRLAKRALFIALVALIWTGQSMAAKLQVVTTIYPLYEFAQRLVAGNGSVTLIVPAGSEPHHWEPTARDIARMRQADVLIYNSSLFETWIAKVVENMKGKPVVEAARGLVSSQPAGGQADPHVWTDPVLAQAMAERIAAAIYQAAPANAAETNRNLAALRADLNRLHQEFEQGLKACKMRDVIVSHNAFSHLAQRYSLNVYSIYGVSPEAEPSPAHLAELVRLAREKGIKTVFSEALVSPRAAQAVAGAIGAEIRVLHPIGGLTRAEVSRGENYFSLMRANLAALRSALECD